MQRVAWESELRWLGASILVLWRVLNRIVDGKRNHPKKVMDQAIGSSALSIPLVLPDVPTNPRVMVLLYGGVHFV